MGRTQAARDLQALKIYNVKRTACCFASRALVNLQNHLSSKEKYLIKERTQADSNVGWCEGATTGRYACHAPTRCWSWEIATDSIFHELRDVALKDRT